MIINYKKILMLGIMYFLFIILFVSLFLYFFICFYYFFIHLFIYSSYDNQLQKILMLGTDFIFLFLCIYLFIYLFLCLLHLFIYLFILFFFSVVQRTHNRSVKQVHHAVIGSRSDVARIARIVAERAIALALG
jgi:hypothetical protein